MNYPRSTQLRHWTLPHPPPQSPTDALARSIIEYMHSIHATLGLSETRSSFVCASHYARRMYSLEEAPCEEWPFTVVALALLFLASKVEEVRWRHGTHGCLQRRGFRVEVLVEGRGCGVEDVLRCEAEILDVLNFDLVVHLTQPRPLPGSREENNETRLLAETWLAVTMSPMDFGKEVCRFEG